MAGQNAQSAGNKVVISGIAGRFPNSNNITELQNNLLNKVDCTTTEHKRWNLDESKIPNRLGVCNGIEKFDRIFFGIHTALTDIMDPVSRMLLEHSFEAIMDAGINPRSLRGEKIAVYTATNLSESEKRAFDPKAKKSGFGIMGGSKAMIANRISFFLGLTGPSINIDCDTTGSGVALERAYLGIKNGEFNGAIIAGGIIGLLPHVSYQLRLIGRLSSDGLTRSFDDDADGHARSDGLAVLFLQRSQDAKRIYVEVLNVAAPHLGPFCNATMTDIIPKREPQVKLMKQLLKDCGLSPDDITFLEATGMGLKDVDADELEAIAEVYKNRKNPLLVGAIQSNLGNTIPINTAAGIIKMIIASETGQIPPNVNYDIPNSKAPCLEDGTVEILTEMTPWTGQYSSVHTVSLTGSITNVLLKTHNIEKKNEGIPDDDLPRLIVASGRTEEAVDTILSYMENRPVDVELVQMFYDMFESGIDGHMYRGYSVVPAKGVLPPDAKKRESFFNSGETRQIWWVFSGMGSQWVGMGEALLKLPVFDASIRKCDAILKPRGFDIYKIICEKDEKMFDNIVHSFIGIAAIQIALVDVLRDLGMKPDFIIGHSVGELGCAYADGCFTAEQMILAALSRGLASKEVDLIQGAMAAVGLGYNDVKPLCPPDIDIACHNSPDSSTISGPAESLRAFVASLTAKKIFAKEVASSNIAYHSRYIAPAGPKLLEYLQKVIPKPNPRSEKWLSTSVPRSEWNTLKARLCSAEYHTNNLLSPVLFEETSRIIPQNAICIEIAPHGLLQAILKKSLSPNCTNVPLTKRGHPDNVEFMLTALGKLYNIGLTPKISNLYPRVNYPVGRGTPSISSLVKWDHNADWYISYFVPVEKTIDGEVKYEMNINAAENEYLKGCRINDQVTIPISLCLIKAWELLNTYNENPSQEIVFENVHIYRLRVTVPEDDILKLTVVVTKGNKKFDIVESDTLVATGAIKTPEAANIEFLDASKTQQHIKYDIENEDFYEELGMRGYEYSGSFKNVLKSSMNGTGGLLKWDNNWVTFIESAIQLYAFGNDVRQPQVPFTIRKLIIDHQKHEAATQGSGVAVFIDKNLNCITAGGLEIQGLKLSTLPKVMEQKKLSSDILAVVPNIDKSNTPISESLRTILQVVLENNFSNNIPVIQIIENEGSEASKAYQSLLYSVPERCLFKYNSSTCEAATFNKALTILVEDLSEYDVSQVFQKLRANKFLLTTIKNDQEDSLVKLAESLDLKVVLVRKFINNKNLVLFRKKQLFSNTQVINVNGNVKDTINKVSAIGVSSDDERIVIVTKPKDKLNIIDFVKQLEQSTKLDKIRIFDIQDANVSDNIFSDQLYKKQLEIDLLINVLTAKKVWATLRRVTAVANIQACKNWTANQLSLNDPHNVTWTEGPSVEQSESIIKVEYSSFNAQDILLANNSFYSETWEISGSNRISPATLGFEYSGTDAKGNRVMGITCGSALSTFVKANPLWTWAVPQSWSFEDGATIPLSYIIAYATLFVKAEIEEGERVLLHNITDGPGLAMLNLAIRKKCDVFATYQTEQERKLIKLTSNLPDNRLFDASKESFTDDIVMKGQGQGVDVAICNQCGAKKAESLFAACKRKARVVLVSDMNDNRFHESIGMEIFLREINFFSVVPKQILVSDSNTKRVLANFLHEGIKNGNVKPLARNIYETKAINEAFHACLSKSNLGKILVKVAAGKNENQITAVQRFYCSSSKTYVIIEGLNAFGFELVDWLITRGAKRVVLVSHSEVKGGYANLRLSLWQKYGVQVVLRTKVDVTQPQNIKTILKEASSLGPIDAIFDLQRMSSASGKINTIDATTKTLDLESRLSSPKIRLFAVFSGVVNALALPSKFKFSKYYSIDDAQERPVKDLLEKRKKDGLHSVLIRWGIKNDDLDTKNLTPPIQIYLQKFDDVLTTKETAIEVSYVIPLTDEVEVDTVELHNQGLQSERLEYDAFMAIINAPQERRLFDLVI